MKKVHFLKVIKYFCLFFCELNVNYIHYKGYGLVKGRCYWFKLKKTNQLHIFDLAK